MTSTYSNLKIELMGTGDQSGTWGTTTNTNLGTAIEEAIVGSANVSFSSADVDLTLTDVNTTQTARNLRLNLTGTSGGARNLYLSTGANIEKLYIINNGLADTVTVRNKIAGSPSGTSVSVPASTSMFVYNNGTDISEVTTFNSTGNFTTVDTTNLEVTNIKAKDGTAAATIADSTGVVTVTAAPVMTALTASQAVFTTAGKALTSNAITGTGNVVMSASPTLTGTIAGASLQLSSLTSGRVTYAGASGLLQDSANLLYSGTDLTVYGITVGRGAGAVSTNTAVGASALVSNTTGAENVAVGNRAAESTTTAVDITAVGFRAARANTTGTPTAFGAYALDGNTTGAANTAIGSQALASNTTASNNTAVGYQAAYTNNIGAGLATFGYQAGYSTTADYNNFFGYRAGYTNGSGTANSAFGTSALYFNTTGSYNTAVGNNALQANTTASNNTAVGYQAGYSNQTSSGNTFIGIQAGYATTGARNTFVGDSAGTNVTTGARNTFIGGSNGVSGSSGSLVTTGSANTILGNYTGNQGGLDIRTASNYIVLSDGDGNPRLDCTANGDWEIGPGSAGSSTGVYKGIYSEYGVGLSGMAGEASLVNNLYYATGAYRFLATNGSKAGALSIRADGSAHLFAATNSASAGSSATVTDLWSVSAGNTFALQGSVGPVSGTGITFPATQSASSDANTLDDYEEGTWTPSLGGNTTYTTQTGTYTKIGNLVFCTCQLTVNVQGTGATATIAGLPFTNANNSQLGASVGYFTAIATNIVFLTGYVNTTNIVLTSLTAAGAGTGANAIFQNGSDVRVSVTYRV